MSMEKRSSTTRRQHTKYWRRQFLVATACYSAASPNSLSIVQGFQMNLFTVTTHLSNRSRLASTRRWLSTDEDPQQPDLDEELPKRRRRRRQEDPRAAILDQFTEDQDKEIVETTLDWLQRVVIGLSLCPFADKPFQEGNLSIDVMYGANQVDIMARVLAECVIRQEKAGTSLLVCPHLFPHNFDAFLEVYNMIQEGMLVEHNLNQDLQIAPFHPDFEFEGSGKDGVDNLTNQSPYPIFHILREDEVSAAVDLLDGDASKVWRRNVQLFETLDEEMNIEELKDLVSGSEQSDESRKKVKKILKKIRDEERKEG